MLNLGTPELFVIAIVALVVLGPTRLPGAARSAGKAMGDLRRMTTGFQAELTNAMQEPVSAITPDPVPATTAKRPRRAKPLQADAA